MVLDCFGTKIFEEGCVEICIDFVFHWSYSSLQRQEKG